MTMRRSATARGYDSVHRAERAKWVPRVITGTVVCGRCGRLIAPDEPWDLGHTDDRKGWTGPEHRACNRAAGGRNSLRIARERAEMVVRDWD